MKQPQVVVAGHICLDVIPNLGAVRSAGGAIYRPGGLTVIGGPHFAGGGAVHNVGVALHRLGVGVALMGKVGDDLFGRELLRILQSNAQHLADGMRVARGETTSYSIVISPPDADRAFLHCPGANHSFGIGDVDCDLVGRAKVFHLGYPPSMAKLCANNGAELAELYRRAKQAGATTSLDMCAIDPNSPAGKLPWRAILGKTLPHVDLFQPSIDELAFMLGTDVSSIDRAALRAIGDELIEMGCAVAAIKLGEEGLYLRSSNSQQRFAAGGRALAELSAADWLDRDLAVPCFAANFVSATGSGDATIAGLIAAILHREPAEEAATTATAVGGASVEAPDATGGVPAWDDIKRRVEVGWARRASRFA